MKWTMYVLEALRTNGPLTMREINSVPRIRLANVIHGKMRVKKGKWKKPVNSMAYDTLVRLRKRGLVERCEDGKYRLLSGKQRSFFSHKRKSRI